MSDRELTRLTFHANDEFYYLSDVDRIVSVFAERGYEVSRNDAKLAWRKYSDDVCASWLFLPPEDDTLFNCIRGYFDD
jgi:hypothetical protein